MRLPTTHARRSLVACALALLCVCPASLHAQETVEPLPEVVELNERAVRLAISGDVDGAIALFEQSLALQELNITWLNLGRTWARKGECDEAQAAYDRTIDAPKVEDPTPEEVLAAVYTYNKDLREKCDARRDADTALDAPPTVVVPTSAPLSFSPWSWIALGTGSAMVLAATLVDVAVLDASFDELDEANRAGDRAAYDATLDDIDTLQATEIALFTVGGVAMATGLALLITELVLANDHETHADTAAHQPTLAVGADGASLGYRLSW